MADLLIKNVAIYDGTGADPVQGNLAVEDGKVAALGAESPAARQEVDADGLAVMPGFVDLHTHFDAQVTWDRTCSPSPSLGVTTCVMGNCGFGIVPSPPEIRDYIMNNLSVVEGMDLDALRAGIDWQFETFPEYMTALEQTGPYPNMAVFIGHSAVRTAVMKDEAWVRETPTESELAEMRRLVEGALQDGAVGFASSFSINHSGYGGIPMPSTIASVEEFGHLAEAVGDAGKGIVQMSAGGRGNVAAMEPIVEKIGRRMFLTTGAAMYNASDPDLGISWFEDCAAAHARGNELYIQIPCQPLSFDFTMANAYPFHSHASFADIKAASPEELVTVYKDPAFRDRFREDLKKPVVGTIFKGTWDQVVIAAPARAENAALQNRNIADLAAERSADPMDVMFDLALSENLETAFLGKFLNVGDEGGRPFAAARMRCRLPVRRGGTSDLYVRCRVRLAPSVPLGARTRRVLIGRRRAPADQPSRRPLRHQGARPADAGLPCGYGSVRSRYDRNRRSAARLGSAGRRSADDPAAERRARGVDQRHPGLRRHGLCRTRKRPGPRPARLCGLGDGRSSKPAVLRSRLRGAWCGAVRDSR